MIKLHETLVSFAVKDRVEDDPWLESFQDCALRSAKRLEQAEAILQRFADCIFNDNGDITLDQSSLSRNDFLSAYLFMKRDK